MHRRSCFFPLLAALGAVASCQVERRPEGTGDGGPESPDKVTVVVIVPGTPSDAPSQFGGPSDSSAAPTMVYPPDGLLMPPNLSELEVQWKPTAGTTLFELRFVSTFLDLTVYTSCMAVGTGCGYLPDEATWQLMSAQAHGDTLQLTARATAGSGAPVGTATTQTISFADEDLHGGLYYWAAAEGKIVRYDFGPRGQSAESFYGPGEAAATCVGCHALARNGERIAVGLNAPVPTAGLRVLDIATKTPVYNGTSNFAAFSPDASRALVNSGANLSLIDVASGSIVGGAPAIMDGNLPDWSADGSRVVFARNGACPIPGFCASQPGVSDATLFTVPVSGDSFGTPVELARGGGNNFYPAFSPDGSLVAFNRSSSGASSFDAPDARVWIVSASGGTPIALSRASATTSNVGDSWPKFAPYAHRFKGETIFWLTFSSRRDYGLRLLNSEKVVTADDDPRRAQIWMVAVPASALASGAVPVGGYPAFWLPFQSLASGNHIAQWVEKIVRQPCGSFDSLPCPNGDTCENGVCVGVPIL